MFANDPKKSLSSYVCKRPLKLNVILRPPKDLAVLHLYKSDGTNEMG